MKLCKDCKHYKPFDQECRRSAMSRVDTVTGGKFTAGVKSAYVERGDSQENKCGPEGRFFEKRGAVEIINGIIHDPMVVVLIGTVILIAVIWVGLFWFS